MFSQVPKKIAGQLAQYSPIAALTMIVGHGTDAAFAAEPEPTDGVHGDPGADPLGTSRLASLTSGASCAEPTLAARPAVSAVSAAPPPAQVVHEVIKQVPVPVPSSGGTTKVLVQQPEYHTTKVTNIDNHPTTVNTTVNQQINAGGDVTTSVNTNTVSGKGALGTTDADHVDADGGATTVPELDDDFGAGAKPTSDEDSGGTGEAGDGSSEGSDGTDGAQPADEDGSEPAPVHGADEPVQPDPELQEGPPVDDGDPDGPLEEPQDHLAQAVQGGADDPLAPDLVGGPAGEPLPHEVPPADEPNGDLLGHTLVGPEHHADPGTVDHDAVDPAAHDSLVI